MDNQIVKELTEQHDYDELMRLIDGMRARVEKRLECADSDTHEAIRAREDAQAYLSWYYTWVDNVDRVRNLDRQWAEAKKTRAGQSIAHASTTNSGKLKKTLHLTATTSALGILAIVFWPTEWWIWVVTASSIITATYAGMKREATTKNHSLPTQVTNQNQMIDNILEARSLLLEQINAHQPESARVEMAILA